MKRSTHSENLIVVTAIAIAISLLASACGSGNTRTLKAKVGSKTFGDKNTLGKTEEVQTEKEAIEELLTKGNSETPVDAKSAQDLASRLRYVQYAIAQDGSSLLTVSLKKNDKNVLLTFESGAISEDGSTINFSKPSSASETIDTTLSAKIIKQTETLVRVFLTEKSTDAKNTSEVSLIVKLNSAEAQVNSKDAILLKMKDSFVETRITQAYVGTEKIASSANRIMISVIEKGTLARLYSLLSLLKIESNSTEVLLNNVSELLKESINAETYKMSLEAGSAVLDAKQISLKFVNNKSKEESNVLLTLIDVNAQKETSDESTSQDAAAEEKKDEPKSTEEANATKEVKATDAKKSETATESDISTDFIFDSTPVELKQSTSTAKPSFNNVKGGSASTEKAAPKATTQKQNKVQTTSVVSTAKTVLANDVTMAKALIDSNPIVIGTKIASGTIVVAAKNPTSITAAAAKTTQLVVKQTEKSRAEGAKALKENIVIGAKAAQYVALNATPAGVAIKAANQLVQASKAKTAKPKATAAAPAKKSSPKAVKIKAEGV